MENKFLENVFMENIFLENVFRENKLVSYLFSYVLFGIEDKNIFYENELFLTCILVFVMQVEKYFFKKFCIYLTKNTENE